MQKRFNPNDSIYDKNFSKKITFIKIKEKYL